MIQHWSQIKMPTQPIQILVNPKIVNKFNKYKTKNTRSKNKLKCTNFSSQNNDWHWKIIL